MPASTLGSMKSIKSLAVAHILNMLIMSWRPRGYLICTAAAGYCYCHRTGTLTLWNTRPVSVSTCQALTPARML